MSKVHLGQRDQTELLKRRRKLSFPKVLPLKRYCKKVDILKQFQVHPNYPCFHTLMILHIPPATCSKILINESQISYSTVKSQKLF